MKTRFLLVSAVILSSCISSSASADLIRVTFTGTVNRGSATYCFCTDTLGIFGPVGGDLTGSGFTSIYLFNSNLGQNNTNYDLFGGDAHGTVTPLLNASLTINGIRYHTNGKFDGTLIAQNSTEARQALEMGLQDSPTEHTLKIAFVRPPSNSDEV